MRCLHASGKTLHRQHWPFRPDPQNILHRRFLNCFLILRLGFNAILALVPHGLPLPRPLRSMVGGTWKAIEAPTVEAISCCVHSAAQALSSGAHIQAGSTSNNSSIPWCCWPSKDMIVHLHAFMVHCLLLYRCSASVWPVQAAGTSNGSSISLLSLAELVQAPFSGAPSYGEPANAPAPLAAAICCPQGAVDQAGHCCPSGTQPSVP